ncbi:MAG: hypothetical protein J0665_20145 [Deltaproteobacteria bacterium]|nr:hypothetical protein [Deltaproteobacteria bacterium]
MQASSSYKITNPEIASFIEYRTGRIPALCGKSPGELVTIEFPSTDDVVQAALEYVAGCPESRLLNIRTRLYRRIREVKA